jgi:hypothetical protein
MSQTMMLLSNCFTVSLPFSHMAVTWETVGALYLLWSIPTSVLSSIQYSLIFDMLPKLWKARTYGLSSNIHNIVLIRPSSRCGEH